MFKALSGAHYGSHRDPERADVLLMLTETNQFCEEVNPNDALYLTEGSVPELTPGADPLQLLQHHVRHEKAAMVEIVNRWGIESRIGDGDDISRALKFADIYGCSAEDWIMLNLFRECTSYNPAQR